VNELALFAGAGGGLLGSRLIGWRTVCAVEINDYCRRVLLQRQRDGQLEQFPIWDDARTFDGRPWRGCVDIVSAGFPCQPFSSAGRMLGAKDERNMWPSTIRIIREVAPPLVWLENTPGLRLAKRAPQQFLKGFGENRLPAYLGTVLCELAESGYDAKWESVPASYVGANHIRDRVWILAYAASARKRPISARQRKTRKRATDADVHRKEHGPDASRIRRENGPVTIEEERPTGAKLPADADEIGRDNRRNVRPGESKVPGSSCESVAAGTSPGDAPDPDGELSQESRDVELQHRLDASRWWASEPHVDRMGYGLASRVDRTEAIGNGQVPAVVRAAWEILTNGGQLPRERVEERGASGEACEARGEGQGTVVGGD